MIFNMVGGGSNYSLNFKIIGGTTQPENPTENTIWIDTDTEITSWVFSATEPTNKVNGMVWICISDLNNVEFNALKKNGIQLCPIFAKQYINTAWVVKSAKIYQSNKWIGWWNGEIFGYGNAYHQFVKTDTENYGGYTTTNSASKNKGSVTISDNDIHIYCYETSGGNNSIQFVGTNKIVDLSNYSTLNIEFSSLSVTPSDYNDLNWVVISATPSKTFPGDTVGAAYKKITSYNGAVRYSIDISNLDEAYIVITANLYSSDYTINAHISKIWLE